MAAAEENRSIVTDSTQTIASFSDTQVSYPSMNHGAESSLMLMEAMIAGIDNRLQKMEGSNEETAKLIKELGNHKKKLAMSFKGNACSENAITAADVKDDNRCTILFAFNVNDSAFTTNIFVHSDKYPYAGVLWVVEVRKHIENDMPYIYVLLLCYKRPAGVFYDTEYEFRVLGQKGKTEAMKKYCFEKPGFGPLLFVSNWNLFCDKDNDYVDDNGNAIFQVDFFVKAYTRVREIVCPGNSLWTNYATDPVLLIENYSVRVKKEKLSAVSTYFMNMFAENSLQGKKAPIKIEGVRIADFVYLLNVVYGGNIRQSNVGVLLQMSERFQVPSVTEECQKFLNQALEAPKEQIAAEDQQKHHVAPKKPESKKKQCCQLM